MGNAHVDVEPPGGAPEPTGGEIHAAVPAPTTAVLVVADTATTDALMVASGALHATARRSRAYLEAARAPATRRAYAQGWRHFTTWCATRRLEPLPAAAETVALYLTDLADATSATMADDSAPATGDPALPSYTVNTLSRRLAAIAAAHADAQLESPTRSPLVQRIWRGIRRTRGVAPQQKAPIETALLRRLLAAVPAPAEHRHPDATALLEARDRALLLLGFAGAFRRAELVALTFEDIQWTQRGLTVRVRRSKTDQEGVGRSVGIPTGRQTATCPVAALRTWLTTAGLTAGPLFRGIDRHGHVSPRGLTDQSVALIVKRTARAAGLPDETVAALSGHSLRAGFATSAARAGLGERQIMRQTGHKSVAMVHRYIRDASLFDDNPADRLGL